MPFAYFFLREDNVLLADPDPYAFLVLCAWLWIQLWVMGAQSVLGPRFGIPKGWVREAWDYHPVLRDDDIESGGGKVGGSLLPIGLARTGTGLSTAGSVSSPVEERGFLSRAGTSSSSTAAAPEAGESSSSAGGGGSGTIRSREREKEREREQKQNKGGGVTMRSVDCAICREILEVPVFNNKAGPSSESAAASGMGRGGITSVFARKAYMVTPCRHIFHTDCLEGWMKYRLQCPICREELPPL